ncbi:hypothetical protein SERLADRAFT_432960 [Serpula lacrymans var. lacrymans S7.9]|uniref:Uncharacterized protein n=1 Tax=Serpula lacrymans var. lacrymans (strain S7.9) TaxID=578457 RepID=F8NI55_SERL9|nr:uncharacterized protein SERLADRAFT_432960 [Serpula lacrymans var. lacrymans S7.9]EGO28952.1 hypothetical protein SERLADRAFT_432960 [Serpula lacrymans var. lacrymans S7.9]
MPNPELPPSADIPSALPPLFDALCSLDLNNPTPWIASLGENNYMKIVKDITLFIIRAFELYGAPVAKAQDVLAYRSSTEVSLDFKNKHGKTLVDQIGIAGASWTSKIQNYLEIVNKIFGLVNGSMPGWAQRRITQVRASIFAFGNVSSDPTPEDGPTGPNTTNDIIFLQVPPLYATSAPQPTTSAPLIAVNPLLIESLSFEDILKNHHFSATVQKYQIAADQFLESQAYQNKLAGQIEGLLAKEHIHIHQQHESEEKIRKYKDEVQELTKQNINLRQENHHLLQEVSHLQTALGHQTNSVPAPQPCPDQYPFEILWEFDDCKKDEDAGLTAQNPAQPAIECAVRHADGTMISSEEWTAIKATTRVTQNKLEQLPLPKCRSQKWSRNYYQSVYPAQWAAIIQEMEQQQPLLTLCFSPGPPSSLVLKFIERIECADPNSPKFNEDDHGNCETARHLIAATRHICFQEKILSLTFLADNYLNNILEQIWAAWKAAGGPVSKGKASSAVSMTSASASFISTATDPPSSVLSALALTFLVLVATSVSSMEQSTVGGSDLAGKDDRCAGLQVSLAEEELMEWIKASGNVITNLKQRTKKDLVTIILALPIKKQPSEVEVESIMSKASGPLYLLLNY